MASTFINARSIAIIGGGPSGLVAAKYLSAEKAFDKIVEFEQRSSTGGIWNYTPDETNEDIFTIPQTSPAGGIDKPVWRPAKGKESLKTGHNHRSDDKVPSFISPLYERLETNIPRSLMGFSDLNWPQDSQLFPKHETALGYIQQYGEDVKHLVRVETQVVDVRPATDNKWLVKSVNVRSKTELEEIYDGVIVANGHFIVPFVPDIEGLKEWNEKYPGVVSHSKYFRKPDVFAGKKTIVIGNSASGLDISSQIAPLCTPPLLWSQKAAPHLQPAPDPSKLDLPPIAAFIPESRSVRFENGRVESDIDAVVFCTGYFYSLPFLRNVSPSLITDGSHVEHTYKHLFYAPNPTLSLVALPQRVIPFPVAEAQSAVLARVYAGRLPLPSTEEMQKWENDRIAEVGAGRDFHLLPFPKDAEYINELSRWALSAPAKAGLENGGQGKVPPVWGKWEYWCRDNFAAIRRAFVARGDARASVRTLEELGFDFKEYLREKESDEKARL
ncbi:FAD/NAD(P)-binding domain-containing protein [Mytilinidion resinicola]|uniref:FAD/NAD(P)-binding domain-containing protein n=1 Tax=Mytilinidion resinicola TaxID=574789 RepID=A0A6A6Y3L5_9PEZI|nr:FAD/NAD(P)-binding domain-containing protein [Mytilinidion resinicola]KAF2803108.1 FAD/NAD(P)-binding domain-containing protein [Mytilinidion resinicola]